MGNKIVGRVLKYEYPFTKERKQIAKNEISRAMQDIFTVTLLETSYHKFYIKGQLYKKLTFLSKLVIGEIIDETTTCRIKKCPELENHAVWMSAKVIYQTILNIRNLDTEAFIKQMIDTNKYLLPIFQNAEKRIQYEHITGIKSLKEEVKCTK